MLRGVVCLSIGAAATIAALSLCSDPVHAAEVERGALGDLPLEAPSALAAVAPRAAAVPAVLTRRHVEPAVAPRVGLLVGGAADALRHLAAADGVAGVRFEARCAEPISALRAVASGELDVAVLTVPFESLLPHGDLREVGVADFVVALVRHPDNPAAEVSHSRLAELCRGRARDWAGGETHLFSAFSGAFEEARALQVPFVRAARAERGLSVAQVCARVGRDRAGFGLFAAATLPEGPAYVSVDGVAPSLQAYAGGTYPFGYRLRVVHRADARPEVAALLSVLQTEGVRRALAAGVAP